MVEERKDFETYLISSLNDSLIKKSIILNPIFKFICLDEIKSLKFESWWLENKDKNMITVIFNLDGNPHEIIIKDTKYFVKELYGCEKHKNTIVTVISKCSLINIFSAGIYLSGQRLIYLESQLF